MTFPWWTARAVYGLLYGIACALTWRFHAAPTSLMLAWLILFFDVPLRLWKMLLLPERIAIIGAIAVPLFVMLSGNIPIAFVVGELAVAVMAMAERSVATRAPL